MLRRSTKPLSRVVVSRFLRPPGEKTPSISELKARCDAANEDLAHNFYTDWIVVQGYLIPYRIVRLRREFVAISENPVAWLTPDSKTPLVWLQVFLAYFLMRWLVRGRIPGKDFEWPDPNEKEFKYVMAPGHH